MCGVDAPGLGLLENIRDYGDIACFVGYLIDTLLQHLLLKLYALPYRVINYEQNKKKQVLRRIFMKLAAHELNVLSELSMSCVNSITNMAYMLEHVQDPQLKSIVERHFPLHVRDYNMKVEFLHQASGATQELPLLKEVGQLKDYTQSGFSQYPPIQPRTMIDNFNDREMATSYLLTLKRAGREYAWLAMEAANPELRSFLQTAFMMSCSHAYDVWQYMVSKGYYPLEAAQPDIVGKVGGMYQVVPEDQPQIQQYLNQYQNPIVAQSEQLYK